MRFSAQVFMFLGLALNSGGIAFAGPLQAERDNVLAGLTRDQVAQRRSACAMGQIPAKQATLTGAGFKTLSAGAYCVTVLTRAGRDGALGYVSDPRTDKISPAIAFDSGFVGGYLKRDAIPAGAPSIAVLLPFADRCLDQEEPNTKACSSAGYILGLRAAHGEVVPAS